MRRSNGASFWEVNASPVLAESILPFFSGLDSNANPGLINRPPHIGGQQDP